MDQNEKRKLKKLKAMEESDDEEEEGKRRRGTFPYFLSLCVQRMSDKPYDDFLCRCIKYALFVKFARKRCQRIVASD